MQQHHVASDTSNYASVRENGDRVANFPQAIISGGQTATDRFTHFKLLSLAHFSSALIYTFNFFIDIENVTKTNRPDICVLFVLKVIYPFKEDISFNYISLNRTRVISDKCIWQ